MKPIMRPIVEDTLEAQVAARIGGLLYFNKRELLF